MLARAINLAAEGCGNYNPGKPPNGRKGFRIPWRGKVAKNISLRKNINMIENMENRLFSKGVSV